jgi:cohesin complex subunit SA-1/2
LIARTKESRTLKTNLNLLIPHLIKTLSLSPLLYLTADTTEYSTVLIPLLLAWLHSMSSSPLRPIRHTSTYLSLKINTALCDVAAGVSSDLSLKQRQKDAEVKKGGQSAAAQKKLKELEAKVKDARQKKERLEEYMQETFDV